ncbi:MAG TPA: DUF4097 family beta strand repeat-containing protein [Candidatus Aminicenantes bacterium]|nr:DUF4097 family beta strand repeat-containing protein [Candidatus Aminicenantes bacterium]
MKKKEIVLVVVLIAFGLAYRAVEKGRARFARDFSFISEDRRLKGTRFVEFPGEEEQFPGVERVVIDNPAGEVAVGRSEDDRVHLASVVRVFHSGSGIPAADGPRAVVRSERTGGVLKASVHAPSPFPYRSQRVLLRLRIPAGVALAVANREGDVIVRDAGGDVAIDQENGGVVLENAAAGVRLVLRNGTAGIRDIAGHAEIEAAHAKVSLAGAGSLRLDGRHGEFSLGGVKGDARLKLAYSRLRLDGAGRLEAEARHTPIEARNVPGGATVADEFAAVLLEKIGGDIRVSSRSGRIDLLRVAAARIVLENHYADIVVSDLTGVGLDVLLNNGNLDLAAARVSERVNVKAKYSELNLSFVELADPTVSIKAVHGRISVAPGLELETFEESDEAVANRSGQKPEILVHNTYGNVKVSSGG